jgi:ATP-dependent exoDNAse (exonuclease V) beta subunit
MNLAPSFHVYNASAGSGKTFTLVKEYLKIILGNVDPEDGGVYAFQNILAITFTNKAAAEMKERILENLQMFSEKNENDMFLMLSKELRLNKNVLFDRSSKVLDAILQNYSAFNITTIDSFTYKIVRTFAYDLDLPLNFEVEMDPSQLLSEAIDVLISKIGIDKKLTDVLIDYSIQKIDDDKAWDISNDLNSISKILLNEEDALQFRKFENKTLSDFKKLDNSLQKEKRIIEALFIEKGKEGMAIIDNSGLLYNDFPYSELPNFFKKLINFKNQKKDTIKFSGRLYNKVSSGVLYAASKKKDVKERIDAITPELTSIYFETEQIYNKHFPEYVLMELVAKSLIPLAVLNNIQKELSKIKEQNNICFNSEFNQLISDKIKNEPTPFIYERIGEKFKHYFIDEMQDTSLLQWQNLIPLIDNALSQEKGGLMLVGDGKQAIYRWRGGKAEQFIDLANEENPFFVEKEAKNLGVNYRSYSEIINFNNKFFAHISQYLINEQYRFLYEYGTEQKLNSNVGGYVQVDFVDKYELTPEEKTEAYPQKVFEVIEDLDVSFKKSDVCVLVRGKKEGVAIANYLSERNIKIISSETLLIQNSNKVQFLVDLLSYIHNPLDLNSKFNAVLFLYDFLDIQKTKHLFFEELIPVGVNEFFVALDAYSVSFDFESYLKIPFYEGLEEMIRAFHLMKTADAYVQFFMDFVLDFQRKNKNELSAFLQVWNQKKEKLSIVSQEDDDAVRIMTIHKSKGLEFPVVIFPCDLNIYKEQDAKVWYDNLENSKFGDFETSLVSCSSSLALTGELGSLLLERRKEELALDNFNLLYVALTRAVEQLYIITDYKKESKTSSNLDSYSGLYKDFLKSFIEVSKSNSEFTYHLGDNKRICIPKEKPIKVESVEQQNYISTSWDSHDIQIVSNSSKNWGETSEASVKYGLLIHEILSKVYVVDDLEIILDSYILKGELEYENKGELFSLLDSVLKDPSLIMYFSKNQIVVNERPIVTDQGELLVPDRLVFDKNSVVIIDYKTGRKEEKYKLQLESYSSILQNMGYVIERKLLVYIGKRIEVECF